ncbi:MAG: four helix bundle protein [Chitinophagaceae bacterium]|nr:four helix bundle protein [Chitinophagaceae bacterium]
MTKYSTYTELNVWKKARVLAVSVYSLTAQFPKSELYGLTSQIRRASVSVAANIAEGCGRQYKKETLQFLFIARGSLFELEAELYLAFDFRYITDKELQILLETLIECRKLLSGFINYLQAAKLK